MQIANNPFVLRQTQNSPFSHYGGSLGDVPGMAVANFADAAPGYRDGVVTVRVPAEGFFSGVVQLTPDQELTGSYKARRDGETPRQQVLAKGATKLPAAQVDIVLYRSDVLAEDVGPDTGKGNNSLDPTTENWEVVSINASPVEGEMPIAPMTLMHNHFGSDGGTDTQMTNDEFVAALRTGFAFWADKAMCG